MRHKNVNWSMPEGQPTATGKAHQNFSIYISLLMDLRDELQALNARFRCLRFMGIPGTLDRIERNTRKPRKERRR